MITVRIKVVLPSEEARDLELPLNTDIDHLYARLVTREGLPTTTGRGEPIPYGFFHRRIGRYLPAHVSLVDAGVVNSDILDVVPWPTAEPPIRALEEAHIYREHRYVPARWLLGYALTLVAIIAGVVLLAARQAGQPVTDFVDRNPLSISIDPVTIKEETTFMREDSEAGLIAPPGSFSAVTFLSERKVSNPSPGVNGLSEVVGPVFDFVMVSEGAIAKPVVVKLRAPTEELRDAQNAAPTLTMVRWDDSARRWTPLPTRVGRDGYLYAPTMTLGMFGVAQAGEALLWKENGTLEPGSYWGLHGENLDAPRTALADAAGRWLGAEELAALSGLLKPDRDGPAIARAADLSLENGALAMSVSALLGGPLAPNAGYATPVPDDARPVAMGNDVSISEWKVVQVQAPTPYADGLGWTVVGVRCRLVQRGELAYLEYAAESERAPEVAPVDFVWLAHSNGGMWTFARLSASQLQSGVVQLTAPPTRVSLMVYGQPYEAWAVWGPSAIFGQHIFSVGAVSWTEEATIDNPPTETADIEATSWRAPMQTYEAITPISTGEAPTAQSSPTATTTN